MSKIRPKVICVFRNVDRILVLEVNDPTKKKRPLIRVYDARFRNPGVYEKKMLEVRESPES